MTKTLKFFIDYVINGWTYPVYIQDGNTIQEWTAMTEPQRNALLEIDDCAIWCNHKNFGVLESFTIVI